MGPLSDWHARLVAYLDLCRGRSFAYGQHDCALFAAGAIEAMTGEDPAREWRGRYTTLRGGLRVIRKSGYHDHIEAVAALFVEIPVDQALPGDLAVVGSEHGPALGVVQGAMIFVLGDAGLGMVARTMSTRAFRVE
jgi:uncharacterized protein DUF6950